VVLVVVILGIERAGYRGTGARRLELLRWASSSRHRAPLRDGAQAPTHERRRHRSHGFHVPFY
jgi:hypothetical protein